MDRYLYPDWLVLGYMLKINMNHFTATLLNILDQGREAFSIRKREGEKLRASCTCDF
ncbi:hypothetical protein D3C71_2218560 [compost metagenome]